MSTFDVVVIGGGPAGMMAAARAAQYGAQTALIEKNRELGKKLMITGRGRCNFAHAEDDPEALSKDYRNGGDFLLPALRKFGTVETKAFFLRRGVVPVQERGRRIYPKEGQDASSIVNALWTALKDASVYVLRGTEVRAIDMIGNKAHRVITRNGEIEGRAFIIATGGLSFPRTGSTGDGYRWARKAGHVLRPTEPALCPVKLADRFESDLTGLKLKNVRVTLKEDGQPVDERFGEMDFTPFGISGAIIMDMASAINLSLKSSRAVTIHIDLKPALEPERLDARIDRDFLEFSTDPLRFALRKMLPGQIIPEVIRKAGLDMGKPCGETTPEERAALRNTLKSFTVTPTGLLGFDHAIITSGGVRTDDIDPETMGSKLVTNLYFAGEILDVDGPTGGYNLQECWSTGYVAGSAAAESLGFAVPTDEQIVRQMVAARNRRDEMNRIERQKLKEEREKQQEQEEQNREDTPEAMTIKTGPVDDEEFCGWRDPRKEKLNANPETSEQSETDANIIASEGQSLDADESDAASEDVGTFKKGHDRKYTRKDHGQKFHRRAYGERRNYDRDEKPYRRFSEERPRYHEGGYRRHDDERPSYNRDRPYRRYDDERPSYDREERSYRRYDDRPRHDYEERDYRSFNDERPRYDRSDRPRRRYDDERPSYNRSDRGYRRHDDSRTGYYDREDRGYRRHRYDEDQQRDSYGDRSYRRRYDERPRYEDEERPYRRYNDERPRYNREERGYRRRDDAHEGYERPYRRFDDERRSDHRGKSYRRFDEGASRQDNRPDSREDRKKNYDRKKPRRDFSTFKGFKKNDEDEGDES